MKHVLVSTVLGLSLAQGAFAQSPSSQSPYHDGLTLPVARANGATSPYHDDLTLPVTRQGALSEDEILNGRPADPSLVRGPGPENGGTARPAGTPAPHRGVLHVRRESIDPEREYPILGGRGQLPATSPGWPIPRESIDPEREQPILGGQGVLAFEEAAIDPGDEERPLPGKFWQTWSTIAQIMIPGLGPNRLPTINENIIRDADSGIPIGQAGLPLGASLSESAEGGEGTLPVVNENIVRDSGSGIPIGQAGLPLVHRETGLTASADHAGAAGDLLITQVSQLREVLPSLNAPGVQVYAVQISVATVLTATAYAAYRTMGVGGRLRVLTAIVPPQVVMDAMGRTGYRVPRHSVYSVEDAIGLSAELEGLNEEEMFHHLEGVPSDLVEYAIIVGSFVRQARAQEYYEQCPTENSCS